MTDRASPPQPPDPPFEENLSSSPTPAGRLLVQFFLIPLFVVGIAVFVFWLFGAIAVDRKNAAELLNDVRTGSRNQRWQSAFELTKKLPALTDPKERAAFSAAALRAYEGAGRDVLLGMCDRERLRTTPGLSAEQQEVALLNGLRGLVLLHDPAAAALGGTMAEKDPSLRVRREARKILLGP